MFFERPESGELTVLVHLDLSRPQDSDDPREFEELVLSAGGDPVAFVTGQRNSPTAGYFVGKGKLEELQQIVEQTQAELVVFNHTLSPSQERNLEAVLCCRVMDRTGLILDIFAQRARTHEGKLQVELAQLRHMSTRLIRGWTHLERQKGGIGMRGPGETQLETDRRLLRLRITTIEKRLGKVRRQRDQGRRSRSRASVPMVSLVGYTNAGKSTIFNQITNAGVYAEDQLFATLDPTMRRIVLPDVGKAVLADTVGFIAHLPHRLVEAFRATLEEAANADLLLHVVDAADEERSRNIAAVDEVLEEIKAHEIPVLLVMNKIDLLPGFAPRIDRNEAGRPVAVWMSAQANLGLDELFVAVGELLGHDVVHRTLCLDNAAGRLRARLYENNAVVAENYDDRGQSQLEIRLPGSELGKILAEEQISTEEFELRCLP